MNSNDKPRVLVVDDERANITIMADALKADFRTVVAKSGAQAIERAGSETPPDIILLDIVMPEMDGYEVCRILKADERTRRIPVIFVSAMSEVGDETKGLEIGAVDYITKPFNPAIVRARVRAHLESARTRAKISALLDNSGQGFLSFGRNLLVDEEYSQECRKIFGAHIANRPIDAFLYPDDETGRNNFAKNIVRIISEADPFRRDLYISLMPGEFPLNGKRVRAEYKTLGEDKLLLILTDISSQKELEEGIRQERTRLKLIVSAVRETVEFFEVLKDFEGIESGRFEALLAADAPPMSILNEIYRNIHTFKGLFQQMDFIHLPQVLHELEARLSALRRMENGPNPGAIGAALALCDLRQARLRDLAVIEEALGADFLRQRGRITITGEQASRLESLAKRLMEREAGGLDGAALDLLRELRIIRRVNFKSLLSGCPKAALQLAERLGKAIHPFAVEGDDVLVDPDRFGNFARTLIHVFRNAVDHGIETPDERAAMEKDEVGSISCAIARNGGEITLTVRDDGRGLDPNLLRARSAELSHVDSPEVRWMDDEAALDLVFEESFSTRETVSDISGRGMGLSAVRAALSELGGRVHIETKAGEGSAFRFIFKAEDGEGETEGI